MNVHGGPVANGVVFVGRDSDDAEFRESAEKCVADVGPFAVLFGGDGEEFCTWSWMSASSATSPTISIQGCSARVSSSNSRMSLGLFATKILNVLTIVSSLGEPALVDQY